MPETPRIGTEFAGYRIDSLIGRGGMSVVYRAENPRLGNTVALKLLSAELADDETFRERFVKESRLAATLNHPNIIPIYDAGSFDGVLYIAMRYVAGADLKQMIRARGALTPTLAISVLAQVARALDAAHNRGLVHRDVKPANILVEAADGETGHAYLADFGLIKHPASRSGLTATGQFMGTIDYVAPEQIEGKDVDARADVYSLACVLYECLTGRVPFVKDADVAVMWAHINEAPAPVSSLRPEISRAVDAVIQKGLAKEPDDRYQSCSELMAAARTALSSIDETDAQPEALSGLARDPDRTRTAFAGAPEGAENLAATRPAMQRAAPPPSPTVAEYGGAQRSRTGILLLGLVLAAIIGAVAAYALNRSSGTSHAAGSSASSGPPMSMHGGSGGTPTQTDGQPTSLSAVFARQFRTISKTCQMGSAVNCPDPPRISVPGLGRADASSLALTPYPNDFRMDGEWKLRYQAARRVDHNLADYNTHYNTGPCYARIWEHEDYWYHLGERQGKSKNGADGMVFCYKDRHRQAVIVWTQHTTMDPSQGVPFIGSVVAKTTVDAFRYFYYIHHNIGM